MQLPILLIIIFICYFFLKKNKKQPPQTSRNYDAQHTLLTPAELQFLKTLKNVVNNEFEIMCKVRLSDVIKPEKTNDRSQWQKSFNSITCKHLDFVGCDLNTYEIKFAIELDDKSHEKPERIKRDEFLNNAMKSANVPLYRFKVQKNYNAEEIKLTIFN